MIAKLSIAALVLAVAVPVLAQTTATITQSPADACATAGTATDGTAKATDCPEAKPGKLGSNIIPLAGGESGGEESEGGEDD